MVKTHMKGNQMKGEEVKRDERDKRVHLNVEMDCDNTVIYTAVR